MPDRFSFCSIAFATAAFCVVCHANHSLADELVARHSDRQGHLIEFVNSWCIDCHSGDEPTAGLSLEEFEPMLSRTSDNQVSIKPETLGQLELILRRIKSRQMPPPEFGDRPTDKEYNDAVRDLSVTLDENARRHPEVSHVNSIRRLTRTEYGNAIRDLVGIDVDVENLLPQDQSSHGFDNITVDTLPPTLINRYVSAAEKISAAAVGASDDLAGVTIRIPADRSQEKHVAGLPFGTRGGTAFNHHFHQSGEYEIEIKLTRDRDEMVEGLTRRHNLDVLLDRKRVHQFEVVPPKAPEDGNWANRDFTHVDSHLKQRFFVQAGKHEIGVTFPNTSSSIEESKRQPFDASFNRHRHPRKTPAIFQVSIVGPFSPDGPGDTKSRRLIYGDVNFSDLETLDIPQLKETARAVLTKFARRAYRRPVDGSDVDPLMEFFNRAAGFKSKQEKNEELSNSLAARFDRGIQSAVAAVLVNPNFLLRIETQPDSLKRGSLYQIGDFELANRLSWFLWSSIPDETLFDLAEQNQLRQSSVLREQVARMLQDEKAAALIDNFADQWLHLRNLESITPDLRLYPDFDDNLRQSFRGETQGLVADVLQNDLSVLQLIKSDYTFLNQRLAKHYGIKGVQGSHFRKVNLSRDVKEQNIRGGILRHGSVLMVTSYATRTAPTIRGNWVLEKIIGTPAPPPPPNVPNLKENTSLQVTSVRQRLAQHRKDPACASCHNLMDPVGFSLENFDVVGRWREFVDGIPVDSAGRLPDGTVVRQLDDLEQGILERPEMFVTAMTENLMTYALGRGTEPTDGPAIRAIVSEAAKNDFRFLSLINGIVTSKPFRMRSAQ
jgi:hypothetical protein